MTLVSNKTTHTAHGFTLIEMMIVVIVLGILAAIAIPSYQQHLKKTRRIDAQTLLSTTQGDLERCFLNNQTYLHTEAKPCLISKKLSEADIQSEQGFYYLSPVGANKSTIDTDTYELIAIRTASSSQSNDICGDYKIINTGKKALLNTTADLKGCW